MSDVETIARLKHSIAEVCAMNKAVMGGASSETLQKLFGDQFKRIAKDWAAAK